MVLVNELYFFFYHPCDFHLDLKTKIPTFIGPFEKEQSKFVGFSAVRLEANGEIFHNDQAIPSTNATVNSNKMLDTPSGVVTIGRSRLYLTLFTHEAYKTTITVMKKTGEKIYPDVILFKT